MRIVGRLAVAAAVGGAMLLVTPIASAEVNVSVGGLLDVHANSVIDLSAAGMHLATIPDPLSGVLDR